MVPPWRQEWSLECRSSGRRSRLRLLQTRAPRTIKASEQVVDHQLLRPRGGTQHPVGRHVQQGAGNPLARFCQLPLDRQGAKLFAERNLTLRPRAQDTKRRRILAAVVPRTVQQQLEAFAFLAKLV